MSITNMRTHPYIKPSTMNPVFISTGIRSVDIAINGLQPGTVVVVTGRPGEGKSTFVHGILLDAIDKRLKVLLADGEHSRNQLYDILYRNVIGYDKTLYTEIPWNHRSRYEPKPLVQNMLDNWFGNYFNVDFKYEQKGFKSFDEIYAEYLSVCKAENIKLVVFDNLMSLIDSTQQEMNARQSKFMKMCTNLAKSANIVIVLVAHPNGTAQKGYEMDYYQISGTSDLPGLAHCVLQVIKDPVEGLGDIQPNGRIKVLKNRTQTTKEIIDLGYDKATSRLVGVTFNGEKELVNYKWKGSSMQQQMRG